MKIRLQKYLSQCGVASRRGAEELMLEGRIKVNGRVVTELGTKVDPDNDDVRVGKLAVKAARLVYYLLNKPAGFVTTRSDPQGRRQVTDLVPPTPAVWPVGRLDLETEGLIILTNDGELTNQLTNPRYHVAKEYEVVCDERRDFAGGFRLDRAVQRLEKGVYITGYLTRPAQIKYVVAKEGKIYFHIIIEEGKNRQIRKMCHNVGLKVRHLKRIRIGDIRLGNLKTGEFKKIKSEELRITP